MAIKKLTIKLLIDNLQDIIEDIKNSKVYGYILDGKDAKRYYRLHLKFRTTGEKYYRQPQRITKSDYEKTKRLFDARTESVLEKSMENVNQGRTFAEMQT